MFAVLLLAGCSSETGLFLEVRGPDGTTSTAAGVAELELLVGRPSFCDRWVEDDSASRTVVSVSGRNLDDAPYDFLVKPAHVTDLSQSVLGVALARRSDHTVIGAAQFGPMDWARDQVVPHHQPIQLFDSRAWHTPPVYLAADGCLCAPGIPWMGTGSGQGCDTQVVTSAERLADTKMCELSSDRTRLPSPACDGQQYPNEVVDREQPCWFTDDKGCHVGVRNCHDVDNVAYSEECNTPDDLPSPLCDAYTGCEQKACGNVIDCFTQAVQHKTVSCVMRVAPPTSAGGAIGPCPGGPWKTSALGVTSPSCVATVVEGIQQPPFKLGWVGSDGHVATIGHCPLAFAVEEITTQNYDEVPYTHDFYVTVAGQMVLVQMQVLVGCVDGPSLVCQ